MLSLLCVTRGLSHARPFLDHLAGVARRLEAELVLGTHGESARQMAGAILDCDKLVAVEGAYLEQMLDPALAACTGDYILRIDDDEQISPALETWLATGKFRQHPGWYFPRVHLWPDRGHFVHTSPFFPDYQGRLAVPSQSSRPAVLHAGPAHKVHPAPATAVIEHYCFLVKTYEERRLVDLHYKSVITGKHVDVVYPVFPEDAVNLDIREYR